MKKLAFRINLEIFCLASAIRLIIRSREYVPLVFGLYLSGFKISRRRKTLRLVYFLMRYIDDVIDGDAVAPRNEETFIQDVSYNWLHPENKRQTADVNGYAGYISLLIRSLGCDIQHINNSFRIIIHSMEVDKKRAKLRSQLSGDLLKRHYVSMFGACLDIALAISGSVKRGSDFISLANGQYYLYTIRDLEEDYYKGLINVPEEILLDTSCANWKEKQYQEFVKLAPVEIWRNDCLMKAQKEIRKAKSTVKKISCDPSAKIIKNLVAGLERIQRFEYKKT